MISWRTGSNAGAVHESEEPQAQAGIQGDGRLELVDAGVGCGDARGQAHGAEAGGRDAVADDLPRPADEVALEEVEAGGRAGVVVAVGVHGGRDRAQAAGADPGDDAGEVGGAQGAGVDLGQRREVQERVGGGLAGVAVQGDHVAVGAQAAEPLEQGLVGHAVGGDLQDHALRPEGQRVHGHQELGRDVQERGGAAGRGTQPEVAQGVRGDARGRGVGALGAVAAVQELVAGQRAAAVEDGLTREQHLDVGGGRRHVGCRHGVSGHP